MAIPYFAVKAMKRTFHIKPHDHGGWQAIENGNEVPLVVTTDQKSAETAAFDLARQVGDARVLIFNARGELQEERTFKPLRKWSDEGPWG